MSSRILSGARPPSAAPSREQDSDAGAVGTAPARGPDIRWRNGSARANSDSVRWDEPPALIALAISGVIAVAVVVLLAVAIV